MTEAIDVFEFYGEEEDGQHLLILSAIHGKETSGYFASKLLIELIHFGILKLRAGRLTVIPCCNPKAFEEGVLWIDENLNRVFIDGSSKDSYERGLARQIMPYIKSADYLLDVHNQTTDGPPFIIQDFYDEATAAFACAQGYEYIMTGWPEAYQNNPELSEGDTCMYAQQCGTVGITVESGQNGTASAVNHAFYAMLNSLAYLGLTDMSPFQIDKATHYVHMNDIIKRPAHARFAKPWRHMDQVIQGDVIGYSGDLPIKAPYSGRILLPKDWAVEGKEWYYLGCDAPETRPALKNRGIELSKVGT